MATYPYFVQRSVVIAAGGGTGNAQIPVPTLQKVTLNSFMWTSTGAWGFYSITNSNGRQYTDASQAIPIPSTRFQQGASPNIGLLTFPYAFVIEGNDILYFNIIDTSGVANTVSLTFFGQIETGA